MHTLADTSQPHPTLDIAIPVYNEQDDIADAVRRLDAHLRTHVPYPARITVADNASTDETVQRAVQLTRSIAGLRVVHLEEKGRGRALNAVWRESDADIVAYCDVDLSTDLNALIPLIAPLISGHSISRSVPLSNGSRVERGMKREFISRSYNLILRTAMRAKFDAQCGFKAMRTDIARQLLPYVEDTGWFFDTEPLWWPNGSGCGSPRSRSTGSMTPTAASTSSPPRWPTSKAVPAWVKRCRRQSARRRTAGEHRPVPASRPRVDGVPFGLSANWPGSVWWVWRRRSCTRCCT